MILRTRILTSSIFLMFLLISSVTLTNFAYAQSTPKPNIVATSIVGSAYNIPANSKNNEFLVTYANTGNAYGSKSVSLVMYANYGTDKESTHACKTLGNISFTTTVTLNPGESDTISWQCDVYGAGLYQVKSLGKTLNFNVIDFPVNIIVKEITVSPSKPKFGDNAVFFVTMKNTDTFYGSKKISYQLRFSSMDSSQPPFKASFGTKDISLGAGESTTFTVDTVISSESPWSFCVDDFCLHSFMLSESSEQTSPEQTPPSEQEKTDEEKRKELQRDIEEGKTEEEKQADEDRKRLKNDIEEYDKEQEQERESEQQEEEEMDDTDEIEQEEEQVTGSKLVVTDVIITPRKNLKPNDIVTITAVVKNVGDAEGTKSIVPVINAPVAGKSAMVDVQSVTVKPGKEKTLTWQIPILVSGVYDVFVDGKGNSFQVKSTAQDAKKPTTDKKKFDIDDAADFDKKFTDVDDVDDFDTNNGNEIRILSVPDKVIDDILKVLKEHNEKYDKKSVDSSDKKKFDIDNAADFDTNDGESESFEDGVLSSEDLDRMKNVSDMQVIDDLESIHDKILSVDFGSVAGPSDDQTEIKTISEKYDAANNKLRIAIEKREQVNDLKQELEKKREKFNELRDQVNSDIKKVGKTHSISGNPSVDDKLREKNASDDLHKSLNEWVETTRDMDKLTEKIRELEPEVDKQYDEAMKDLDSISDELDKANQSEPNYEDKNQKPFVTDDLKKETYQDATRSIDDIMRATEEYEKNRDALQKQDTLRQIIDEKSNQQLHNDVYNMYFGDKPISAMFYPGDLGSLSSVGPRVEHQNTIWSELEDSGTLQKHKTKALQALEQKSESNTARISTQTELVGKLQDASYFGTIPAQANTDDVATLSFGAMSQSGFDGVLSADIPIKPIFDDGKTSKYSILGGNLAIVDPLSRQIEDVLSIAFGKGRVDHQSGKMTFVINAVNEIGQHKTITLGSNQGDSTVMISGGSEFALTSMAISNTIPLDDVSDKTVQDAMGRQVADEFEQYLVYDVSNELPSIDEWRKLKAEIIKAKEQLQKAREEAAQAAKAFEDSKDPKLREEVEKLKKEIKELGPEINKLDKKWRDMSRESFGKGIPESAEFKEALTNWSELDNKRIGLAFKLAEKMSEANKSGNPDLLKKHIDADEKLRNAEKTVNDLEKRAQDAWNKLDESAKSGRID